MQDKVQARDDQGAKDDQQAQQALQQQAQKKQQDVAQANQAEQRAAPQANRENLDQKLLAARAEFVERVNKMDITKYMAGGFRVKDVLRAIDAYMILSSKQDMKRKGMDLASKFLGDAAKSLSGNQRKEDLLAIYTGLNLMLADKSKSKTPIPLSTAIDKMFMADNRRRAIIGFTMAAAALALVVVALMVQQVALAMILLAIPVALCIYAGVKTHQAVKPKQFAKNIARVRGYAENPDAVQQPNKRVQLQNKVIAKIPKLAPKGPAPEADFKKALAMRS